MCAFLLFLFFPRLPLAAMAIAEGFRSEQIEQDASWDTSSTCFVR
jgi:hypothetical protein